MKIIIRLKLVVISIMLLATDGAAQITTDYDKTVDFTTYKSYTLKGWVNDSEDEITQIDKDRIIDAFKNEFAKRNLVMDDENPDIAVTLYILIKDKTSTTAYTNYYGGMGYRRSFGYGYGGGSTTYSQRDYREGTIIIDFFDEKEKNLIWEGVLKTEVKEKAKKREKTIPENVRKLMYNYPIKPIKK